MSSAFSSFRSYCISLPRPLNFPSVTWALPLLMTSVWHWVKPGCLLRNPAIQEYPGLLFVKGLGLLSSVTIFWTVSTKVLLFRGNPIVALATIYLSSNVSSWWERTVLGPFSYPQEFYLNFVLQGWKRHCKLMGSFTAAHPSLLYCLQYRLHRFFSILEFRPLLCCWTDRDRFCLICWFSFQIRQSSSHIWKKILLKLRRMR